MPFRWQLGHGLCYHLEKTDSQCSNSPHVYLVLSPAASNHYFPKIFELDNKGVLYRGAFVLIRMCSMDRFPAENVFFFNQFVKTEMQTLLDLCWIFEKVDKNRCGSFYRQAIMYKEVRRVTESE